MSERKLAHIEIITDIQPIPGADAIEVCTILGWKSVIAKKDNFKVGDKVIYIEIDSVMPELPEYEFLRNRKFRIRTIKLKGQVSMGLVLPITILEKAGKLILKNLSPGEDITEYLGITKYLSPSEREEIIQENLRIQNSKNKLKKFMLRYSWFRRLFLSKRQKKGFPYWVGKTDEERIQNIPHILEQFKDEGIYVTEKIDYQSGTWTGKVIPKFGGILSKLPFKKFKFIVCSRNLTTNDKNSLYWKIAKKYNLEQILRENPTLTIQGEQGDTKVQDNKYGIREPTMWVFNIIDHEKNYHYNYDEMCNFCNKYALDFVSLITKCKLSELGSTIEEIIEKSKGTSLYAKIPREGIVVRCIKNGQKIMSWKCINPDFLLKFNC